MKKIILLLVILINFTISNSFSQERTIVINVYVMGLNDPIKRIVNSEISTHEQLEAVIRAIEEEFLDSSKYGPTPIFALLDHMREDLSAIDIPRDSEFFFLLYTDGLNSSFDKNLFKSVEPKQYINNPNMLEKFILTKLHTPIKGKKISVVPILTVGRQKAADIHFLQKLSSHEERVYSFNEADLVREKLLNTIESSSVVLSIALDHSASMQSITQHVAYNVIETIKEIFYYKQNLEPKKDSGISLSDFIDIEGGPTFVGSKTPVRPDERYVEFELSSFKIMKALVTQNLYNRFLAAMGRENASKIIGENLPQTNAPYSEILEFIEFLNSQWKGPGTLRLPTEFELEHVLKLKPPEFTRGEPAVRDLTGTMYDDYDPSETMDPRGNAQGTHLVVRGISYEDSDPLMNRPQFRGRISIYEASPLVGFRLVLCD